MGVTGTILVLITIIYLIMRKKWKNLNIKTAKTTSRNKAKNFQQNLYQKLYVNI